MDNLLFTCEMIMAYNYSVMTLYSVQCSSVKNYAFWGNTTCEVILHSGMQWTDHALTNRPGVATFIMNTLRSIWNTTLNTWEAVKHLGARLYSFWSEVLIMAPLRQGPRHLTVKVNGVMWLLFGMLLFGDPPKHTRAHTHMRAGTLKLLHSYKKL